MTPKYSNIGKKNLSRQQLESGASTSERNYNPNQQTSQRDRSRLSNRSKKSAHQGSNSQIRQVRMSARVNQRSRGGDDENLSARADVPNNPNVITSPSGQLSHRKEQQTQHVKRSPLPSQKQSMREFTKNGSYHNTNSSKKLDNMARQSDKKIKLIKSRTFVEEEMNQDIRHHPKTQKQHNRSVMSTNAAADSIVDEDNSYLATQSVMVPPRSRKSHHGQ